MITAEDIEAERIVRMIQHSHCINKHEVLKLMVDDGVEQDGADQIADEVVEMTLENRKRICAGIEENHRIAEGRPAVPIPNTRLCFTRLENWYFSGGKVILQWAIVGGILLWLMVGWKRIFRRGWGCIWNEFEVS